MFNRRNTTTSLLCVGVLIVSASNSATAEQDSATRKNVGKTTYMSNCEACHMMGKNVIMPGKDIVVSSKLASLDEFKSFLSEKHGLMPSFKKLADDSDVVSALYKYTKKLKNQNWTYEPPLNDSQPENGSAQPKNKDGSKNL